MVHTFSEASIIRVIEENEFVKRFFFQIPKEIPFHFNSGQFVILNLQMPDGLLKRSYSIASAPSHDQVIELCISLKPDGIATPFMHKNFYVGARVQISQALGKFHLMEPISKNICFICTGTGIAPLRSMLLSIYANSLSHRNIHLISGNKWEHTILYKTELEQLVEKHPEFNFIPVLSRENPGWKGRTGHIHEVYEEIFRDKQPTDFYLCGWSAMLKEARHRLEIMGYDKNSIHCETFN